jgi:uncharacterized protein (DUF433 family)
MVHDRIMIDPAICTGKPCIRGMQFPVARLLGLLAAGETRESILVSYPCLEAQDNDAALTRWRGADEIASTAGTDTRSGTISALNGTQK